MTRLALIPLFLATFLAVSPAQAQLPGFSFGLGVGPTFPTGDIGDVVDAGFHVQGIAELSIPLVPIGVRANLDYHRMSAPGGGHNRQILGNLNAKIELPLVPLLASMYVIGGPGIYNSGFSGVSGVNGSETNLGLNIGAGVQVGLVVIGAFIEARYHNVFESDESIGFIPVTVGIIF